MQLASIVFVNRYFHPDHSATSQIASDLAFHLAERGWDVEAITSRQRYDDPRARLAPGETVRGVRITRIATTRFGRAFLPGRAIDYLTFYLGTFFALLRRRDAIVIAMTDPPLLSVVAALASRNVVNWVQDLFPEVAEALGIRSVRWLRAIRNWSLKRAKKNIVLGELMAARVPNAEVIHNWADRDLRPVPVPEPVPVPGFSETSEAGHGSGRGHGHGFVIGYSGNLGRAHEFATIVDAMRRLPDVRFVFTGAGAQLERVKREAGANAEFRPYAPREQLSESLSAADAHLVTLQPALEGLIVPSKFYGILAVTRPVIFVGARDGELARIINAHDCGIVVEAGDVDALVDGIRTLAADRERAAAMGARGRALYAERFAPHVAFASWERVLQNVRTTG